MPMNEIDPSYFKRCTLCGTVWLTKDEFLSDPELRLNGYQFTSLNFRNSHRGGVLLFTHRNQACGTTLAIYAQILKERLTGPESGGTECRSPSAEVRQTTLADEC